MIVVTKWGEEVIGALVIRVSKRERKAYVRAWTVLRRYRGKGVGKSLLEEGVKRVMGKAAVKGVEFEEEHASMFWTLSLLLSLPRVALLRSHASSELSLSNCTASMHIPSPIRSVADMLSPVSHAIPEPASQDKFADISRHRFHPHPPTSPQHHLRYTGGSSARYPR